LPHHGLRVGGQLWRNHGAIKLLGFLFPQRQGPVKFLSERILMLAPWGIRQA
jgi:hypothetical protein